MKRLQLTFCLLKSRLPLIELQLLMSLMICNDISHQTT